MTNPLAQLKPRGGRPPSRRGPRGPRMLRALAPVEDGDFVAYSTPKKQIKEELSCPPKIRKKKLFSYQGKLKSIDLKHYQKLAAFDFAPPPPSLFRHAKSRWL